MKIKFLSKGEVIKMSTKGLKLKGGKVVIEDRKKDIRVRKNYSLPQATIDKIGEISKLLGNNSESETLVEIVKIVDSLLVVEEPKKSSKKRKTKKEQEAEHVETTDVEDDDQPF